MCNNVNKYIEYVLSNFAKDFFKEKIYKLDINNDYSKEIKKIIIDPVVYETEEWINKNAILENEKANWKEMHLKYYRKQPCLPTSSNLQVYIPDIKINSLLDAVQGYKGAHDFLKTIENSDLDNFCTEIQIKLNYEHKKEYDDFVEQIKKKLDIPSNQELLEKYPKEKVSKKLTLNRRACEDPKFFNLFKEKFIEAYLSK